MSLVSSVAVAWIARPVRAENRLATASCTARVLRGRHALQSTSISSRAAGARGGRKAGPAGSVVMAA